MTPLDAEGHGHVLRPSPRGCAGRQQYHGQREHYHRRETLRANTTVTYGDPPTEPGMPMNVMAEATSHDMITVSWESPAADGGSDITGYMVQSAYMMADDMMSDWMDVDPAHMGMDMMYMDWASWPRPRTTIASPP